MTSARPERDDFALYYFHQGKSNRAYTYLGAHRTQPDAVTFRVWAPHAKEISVTGDFNGWRAGEARMERISDSDVWEVTVNGVQV